MAHTYCHLGIDMGTSGCRGVAVSPDGAILARHHVALENPVRQGPAVEQDPVLWWNALQQVLDELARRLPCPPNTLAIDGTSATLLLTDTEGRPLGPAMMYNDARARPQAHRIAAVAPSDSGAHGASSSLAKLLWWLEYHPDQAGRAAHALHQADWLAGCLTGRFGLSDENNCLKLGFDPVERAWPAWLNAMDLPTHLLPQVSPPGTPLAPIRPDLARQLGLPRDLQIIAGTTDSIAAFLATGADRPGEAVTSLGSTLAIKLLSDHPIFAPQYGIYSHRLHDRWLVGGASNSGGAVLRQHFTDKEMAGMKPQLRPEQPTGLDYYPLPGVGERFPVCDPAMAPKISPRPEDDVIFFQGLLEGIATIEAQGYALLRELGAPALTSIRTVGGGAGNPAWTRIREARCGVPMVAARETEAAYGAALLGVG
ncbi:FGGY-family carbohydrate kinase [Ectothiorhodospira variabilis]|uniref:FGGY-family carbohydrate kinase n=1 Tax=Ectothiorhodospira variabilis TaxID=505694 RepID=UPI001EFAE5B1|nr:FGGY-family carbohydrate kinase [Ectothiorhodospira variabilis]MCG5493038.1 FGGY-family carbohydrate kinase [Ectothiorhodospira variabilis]MCG5502367.1 FGGY-family carbohydrate kinase [Ectothiorhodospira variabilis]MCG5505867.1 FGGY-family carbohydrate kinase [Ectothiorhodospira variabilis]